MGNRVLPLMSGCGGRCRVYLAVVCQRLPVSEAGKSHICLALCLRYPPGRAPAGVSREGLGCCGGVIEEEEGALVTSRRTGTPSSAPTARGAQAPPRLLPQLEAHRHPLVCSHSSRARRAEQCCPGHLLALNVRGAPCGRAAAFSSPRPGGASAHFAEVRLLARRVLHMRHCLPARATGSSARRTVRAWRRRRRQRR